MRIERKRPGARLGRDFHGTTVPPGKLLLLLRTLISGNRSPVTRGPVPPALFAEGPSRMPLEPKMSQRDTAMIGARRPADGR